MGILVSLLSSILPNFLLQGLQSYLQATTTVAVEGEKTTRQIVTAQINGLVAIRQAEATVVTAGMQHKVFWIPWMAATVPLSFWFAWGVLDTTFPGYLPHVATLPPQLKEYADIAWSNLFYSGAGMAGAQLLATAITRR